ncbi:MAG TPA: hypothetical protein PKL13_00505 [bacterium]|nr:hypothetical protein [bacterium]
MKFIKNPLNETLVVNFMDDSWIKRLLIWLIKNRDDLEINIDWRWEYMTIKPNLLNPIRIIGSKDSTLIFWEEFFYIDKKKYTPIKFLKQIIKVL